MKVNNGQTNKTKTLHPGYEKSTAIDERLSIKP